MVFGKGFIFGYLDLQGQAPSPFPLRPTKADEAVIVQSE